MFRVGAPRFSLHAVGQGQAVFPVDGDALFSANVGRGGLRIMAQRASQRVRASTRPSGNCLVK